MAPQRGAEKLLRIRITNASVDFMLHVRITNDHWMQISLAEPFISQDSEKLRFQKSRKPQSTNVFSKSAGFFARHRRVARVSLRRTAAPTLPRVRILTGHLSIRSGLTVSQADGTRFRSGGGIDLPGFKNVYCLRNWAAKAILLRRILRKLSGICSAFTQRQIGGGRDRLYNVQVD